MYDGWGTWHKFVHVCRRWRHLIFAFPGYLDLRLECKSKTHMQAALDIWPALPLSIRAYLGVGDADDDDDIIGALEHRDRIAGIHLRRFNRSQQGSQLKKCMRLMQEPFPALTSLELRADGNITFDLTDAFLGGSAPLLQKILLCAGIIRFPSLSKLFSSTSGLVDLTLRGIPMTGEGHMSPDAITACLSVLTKLRFLTLIFPWQSTSSPYSTDQHPHPSAHTVLPALNYLSLRGPHHGGYIEDLLCRVSAPLLNEGHLQFYDEPMLHTPRVLQFIHRVKVFKLRCELEVYFFEESCAFTSFVSSVGPAKFSLSFLCSGLPTQVATVERVLAQWPPLVSHVEFLELNDDYFISEQKKWWAGITPWLGFLRPFTAVQTLRLCGTATVSHVTHVLAGLEGERPTEVLPALRTIKVDCPQQGASESEILRLLQPFLVAREESGHPVVVVVNIGPKS